MSIQTCSHCGMILTAKEAKKKVCPVCKRPFGAGDDAPLPPDLQRRLDRMRPASAATSEPSASEKTAAVPGVRKVRRVPTIIGAIFAMLFGAVILFAACFSVVDRLSSAKWPTAAATVSSSEVVKLSGKTNRGRTIVKYRPAIKYAYVVGDDEFIGVQLCFGRDWSHSGMNEASARQIVNAHPAGSIVSVSYDPSDPKNAVLDRKLSLFVWQFIVIGSSFSAIGLRSLLVVCVPSSKQTTHGLFLFQPRMTKVDIAAVAFFVAAFFFTWFGQDFIL